MSTSMVSVRLLASALTLHLAFSYAVDAADDNVAFAEFARPETLADLREVCGDRSGWHGISDQTQCMKRVMARSSNSADPFIALYLLQADKLVDDVQRRRISEATAGVELQKAYLDVQARESASRDSAANIQAQQQQREKDRQMLIAEAQAREQAAAQSGKDQENQREAQEAAIELARQQCVAAMYARPTGRGIDIYHVNQCATDPYAHLRPDNQPTPPRQINCSSSGPGYVSCSEH